MGKHNEELTKAGVMLAGEGLHPSSKGARVRFEDEKRTVIDGSFAETKELGACPLGQSSEGLSEPHRLTHNRLLFLIQAS